MYFSRQTCVGISSVHTGPFSLLCSPPPFFGAKHLCRWCHAEISVLLPGTHIRPHTGTTNARVRTHLGVAVPDGDAAIRVTDAGGTEGVHRWEVGKVLAFDDSFEHEVWNRAESARVVIILDFWHPLISAADRARFAGLRGKK